MNAEASGTAPALRPRGQVESEPGETLFTHTIPARRWIWERVVEPALAKVAHDTLPFTEEFVAEDIDQWSQR